MSKRFTDTELWEEDWFIDLPNPVQFFWIYLKDNCDHAGIWRPNLSKFAKLYGHAIKLPEAIQRINQDKERILLLENGRLFLTGFIPFQYGSVLNLNSRMHSSVYELLITNGVSLGSIRPQIEVMDRVKDKDKDIVVKSLTSLKTSNKERKEDQPLKEKKPLTDVQKVVLAWKVATGTDINDKSWDKVYFPRFTKSADALLSFLGSWGAASDCIQDVYEKLSSKGLTVTLETIVKHATEWKKDQQEKEEKHGILPLSGNGSVPFKLRTVDEIAKP